MDDNPPQENPSSGLTKLDLSQLQGFSFGTQWTEDKKTEGESRHREGSRRHRDGSPAERKDRRGFRKPAGGSLQTAVAEPEHRTGAAGRSSEGGGGERLPRRSFKGGPRRPGPGGDRRDASRGGRFSEPRVPYESPFFTATFYPEDASFATLTKTLRASCRTVELFEIARTVIGKPDRFVVVLNRKPQADASSEKPAPIAISIPDGLPFDTEAAAVSHVMSTHLDKFFDVAEVEVDPPKGNFQVVNKCGVTGELLGPPNYHLYSQIIQRHHAARVGRMSFEAFRAKIETVRDPEEIARWLEKMKKTTRYTWKRQRAERKPETPEVAEAEAPKAEPAPEAAAETPTETPVAEKSDTPTETPSETPAAETAAAPESEKKEPVAEQAEPDVHFDSVEEARAHLLSSAREKVVRLVEHGRFPGRLIESLPQGEIRRAVEATLERQRRFPLDTANAIRGRLRREGFTIFKKGTKGVSYVCAVKRRFRTPSQVFADSIAGLIGFIEAHPNVKAGELAEKLLGISHAPAPAEGEAPANGQVLTAEQREQIGRLQGDLMWLVHEGYVTEFIDGGLYAPPPMVEARKREVESDEPDSDSFPEAVEAVEGGESGSEVEATVGEETTEPTEAEPAPEAPEVPETAGAESGEESPDADPNAERPTLPVD